MAITIEQALRHIYENAAIKSLKILPIESTLGYVLAQDVIAKHNLPPFDNSAMDGYAVKCSDAGKSVEVLHTIFAGDDSSAELHSGHAIKIMTGAKIPAGCECIVPIEEVNLISCATSEETLEIKDCIVLPQNLKQNRHIRFCGEDIQKETLLLTKGQRLHAHHITLLASQGISHVKVFKKPKIAIFASGNELKMHFENVESHQLYNTNTPTFYSRALELGCEVNFIGTANDSIEDIRMHIQSALDSDLIITSGGVSVGDADFTKEAFGTFGYQIIFDKIEIKPGKPTTFGKIEKTLVLNLPGNPLAAALNFELFGQSIILALSGEESKYINYIESEIASDYRLKFGRRTLVPGFFDGKSFTPYKRFSPGMISPLAVSNSYIIIDENCGLLPEGSKVKVISTRFSFTSKEVTSLISCEAGV
ncbi:MAG: molybdopterin molybdotransferase MoeA [Sulfurimonas sp.]|uniref:molybdopterin molybdotransferase MoeA n=1 Tax=Sulfurimonas sp. TaxID=2022749 RepID=UPI002614E591|nr:molybdopterin molybdotransferase MoeA [Sulfurimonas sp.]MCW8895557.1 molybdopterin molybdotransferase MoeA [Sulfurimonas sp.]MCW8954719.1 molybdopterin molybdotransferase MoeA [Sulfurimonas sp.]